MILLRYTKSTVREILCGVMMILFADLMFLFLPYEKINTGDFLYINFLLIATFLLFWSVGFLLFAKRYGRLIKALNTQDDITIAIPEDDSFYSTLIADVAKTKQAQVLNERTAYELNIEDKNEYIAQWAHEVKTPIAVCELLLSEEPDLNLSKEKLSYEVERVKYLVDQVLYSSRVSDISKNLSISQFDLKQTMRQVIQTNASFFIHNNISLDFSMEKILITSDQKWIAYILNQLIHNAAKYTITDGNVRIWTQRREDAVETHIWNDGTGISPEDLHKIFDKGFVGISGRGTSKSTGFGLYLAKKTADALGIRITVTSNENEYAEFTVTIPQN